VSFKITSLFYLAVKRTAFEVLFLTDNQLILLYCQVCARRNQLLLEGINMIKANAANQTQRGMFPMRITSRLSLAAPIVAFSMLVSANFASAQKTETIEGGRTTVALAGSFLSALGSLDVTPGTVGPTRLHNGTVNFPVTGGAIDLDTAVSQILHSGGLTLTAGQTKVTLQSFIIAGSSSRALASLLTAQPPVLSTASSTSPHSRADSALAQPR
jgi:hypothetical protein